MAIEIYILNYGTIEYVEFGEMCSRTHKGVHLFKYNLHIPGVFQVATKDLFERCLYISSYRKLSNCNVSNSFKITILLSRETFLRNRKININIYWSIQYLLAAVIYCWLGYIQVQENKIHAKLC